MITPQRLAQGPSEKIRLHFLLTWFRNLLSQYGTIVDGGPAKPVTEPVPKSHFRSTIVSTRSEGERWEDGSTARDPNTCEVAPLGSELVATVPGLGASTLSSVIKTSLGTEQHIKVGVVVPL